MWTCFFLPLDWFTLTVKINTTCCQFMYLANLKSIKCWLTTYFCLFSVKTGSHAIHYCYQPFYLPTYLTFCSPNDSSNNQANTEIEQCICQSPDPAVTKLQAQMSLSTPEPKNTQFRLMKATKRHPQIKLYNSVTSSQSDSKSNRFFLV